jgi:hypothetical protein
MNTITALCVLLCVSFAAASIEVRSASRTLQLNSGVAREITELTYHNAGSGSISTAEIALVASENLAHLSVSRDNKDLIATLSRTVESNGVQYVHTHTHTHTDSLSL